MPVSHLLLSHQAAQELWEGNNSEFLRVSGCLWQAGGKRYVVLLYMTMFAMNSGVTEEVILCQLMIYSGLECSHTAFPAAGGRGSG